MLVAVEQSKLPLRRFNKLQQCAKESRQLWGKLAAQLGGRVGRGYAMHPYFADETQMLIRINPSRQTADIF